MHYCVILFLRAIHTDVTEIHSLSLLSKTPLYDHFTNYPGYFDGHLIVCNNLSL